MTKKKKVIRKKRQERKSLFGLFRRIPSGKHATDAAEPEEPSFHLADSTPISTARLPRVPLDPSEDTAGAGAAAPEQVAPPEESRSESSAPPIPDTLRIVVPRREEPDPARVAAEAHRRVASREKALRRPPRPSPQKRIEKLAPRSREGGLFSFFFSLIGLIIRMTVVILLVGAIGAIIGYETVRTYVRTPEVVVPNVRGMKLADAFDVLGQKKLALLKERVEPNALVSPGEIIEQKPPPGTKAKQGTAVRVVVSSGRANYIVPDVVGERRENAENKIRGAGLEVGAITYLESETVPRDCVISQNPEPNKGLEKPEPVHLLLSKGPPRGASSSAVPAPSSSPTAGQ